MDCNNQRKLLLSYNNSSYWVLFLIVTYGTFSKQVSKFDVIPYSWNFESFPFLSVLKTLDFYLSKNRGFVIFGDNFFKFLFHFLCHFLRKSPSVFYITDMHAYFTLKVYVS